MLTRGIFLLHDNARPHTARVTSALLGSWKWDVLDHPPHSPDLTPSDFHLFLHLKQYLAGKKFYDDDEVKEEVVAWFGGLGADFCDAGMQRLVPRLGGCLDDGGNCVER